MKHHENYNAIIAIKEMSNGNATVGDMWLEAKSFHKDTPVSEIVKWAYNSGGKLIVTIDEPTNQKF